MKPGEFSEKLNTLMAEACRAKEIPVGEMIAGLEMAKFKVCNMKHQSDMQMALAEMQKQIVPAGALHGVHQPLYPGDQRIDPRKG